MDPKIRNLAIIEVLIFASLLIVNYKFNQSHKYSATIHLLFIVLAFFMILSLFKKQYPNELFKLFTVGSMIMGSWIGVILAIGLIAWFLYNYPIIITILAWTLKILFVAGLVYLIYKLFIPKNLNIFNIASNTSSEKTSKTTYKILAAELAIIALYFAYPYFLRWFITPGGKILLRDPIYLNKEKQVGTFEQLESGDSKKFTYHYSISSWFYINPQPPNTRPSYRKYTNLINYGEKPVVQFNSLENTLRVQTETMENVLVDIYATKKVKYQTWNNLVINYDGGTMDVFLNGELVGTRENIAPYMTYENVVVGEDNGLEGGICNVVYHDKILSRKVIHLEYTMLKERNNPVI